jgi:S-DNA-T family DNA segregation ATPase FtsK/SpoIIIE
VVTNYSGRIGSEISAFLFNIFGYASYIIFLYLLFLTTYFFLNRHLKNIITKSLGYFLLLISVSFFLANARPFAEKEVVKLNGGVIGYFINDFFQGEIKAFLALLLSTTLILVSLAMIAKFSLHRIFQFLFKFLAKLYKAAERMVKQKVDRFQKNKRMKRIQTKYNAQPATPISKKNETKEDLTRKEKKKIVKQPSKLPEETYLFPDVKETASNAISYKPPPMTYLDAPTKQSQIDYRELDEKKEELAQRLNEFRIKGEIMEYTPGPVITTYEFVPDTGVKVKEVINLSEDLALVVKAQYIRIERILGKKAIGIEIPNKKREVIHLREILESEEYQLSSSPLTIALGKTKSGEIFISDLREMPHLIIAGATGSGKSVAIHTIILSILYKSSPDEVKFVLIDPKRVELAIYNSLPHLLTPVVVNTKLAKNALDWTVFEIENRYKKLALLQVRNIEQYNKKIELLIQTEDESIEKIENPEKMPYIVVIIDEFADLMIESSREIEDDIAKIAQKARAVGIHLILATQRPSTDVITGTIKNNFPSRIALAVPSKFDSRTIIDVMGAEKLLGQGDMLFLPPKTATLVRIHCAFVSEEEALRVVRFLSKTGKPTYDTQIIKPKAKSDSELDTGSLDSLFYDAAEIVITTGQASASYLQRKMRIGYARAGRLIDQLQAKEVVSPPNSKNQREILMTMEDLQKMGV